MFTKGRIWLPLIVIAAFMASTVQAQQRAQFSQYMLNPFLINPAAAGSVEDIDIQAGYRQQWAGLEGAPETFYGTAHMRFSKDQSFTDNTLPVMGRGYANAFATSFADTMPGPRMPFHAAGIMFLHDKAGALGQLNILANYAFHIPLGKTYAIAAGVGAGINQYSLNATELGLDNDMAVNTGTNNNLSPDVNAGVYIYSDKLSMGFAAAQLVQDKFTDFSDPNYEVKDGQKMHFYGHIAYKFEVSPMFKVQPNFLYKMMPGATGSMEAGLVAYIMDRFWAGVNYRTEDAIIALVGANLTQRIRFGYSYDYAISELNGAVGGSHELIMGLTLKRK